MYLDRLIDTVDQSHSSVPAKPDPHLNRLAFGFLSKYKTKMSNKEEENEEEPAHQSIDRSTNQSTNERIIEVGAGLHFE